MKLIKWLLVVIIISYSNNALAQDEDYFTYMGTSKADVFKRFSEQKRIINGEYYELAFILSSYSAIYFYFDNNLLCYKVMIHTEIDDFENAKLLLSGDFPKKRQENEIFIYWNSRMMATLMKIDKSIVVFYQKVNSELLKR